MQEQENRQALLRVTLALLHEPLRLYKGASGEVPSLRVAELHDFVHSDSKFGVLEALRKSVFHVPRDHLDEDGLNVQFSSLSISTLDLFEPLLGSTRSARIQSEEPALECQDLRIAIYDCGIRARSNRG